MIRISIICWFLLWIRICHDRIMCKVTSPNIAQPLTFPLTLCSSPSDYARLNPMIFLYSISEIVSEYNQEIPQSQTADKPTLPRLRLLFEREKQQRVWLQMRIWLQIQGSRVRSRSGPILSWRLIMKWFLRSFSSLPLIHSFKKGCCQIQAKVCAQITG